MNPDSESRLAQLEAKDAIRELKARYARACDAGFDLDELAEVFSENAVFDAGAFGRHDGRRAILDYYAAVPDSISWGMHFVANPTIAVADDGQTAEASWYFLQPATLSERAVWVMGSYRDEYVRESDGWRFSLVELHVEAVTPFDVGWVGERFLEL